MIVGVISDTHGLLRPESLAALKDSDFIIHAGDIGDPEILATLEKIAPVTAVRGNVDIEPWAQEIPTTNVLEAGGVFIYVLHDLQQLDLKPEAAKFDAIVYGHSHIAKQEVKHGVLYFNPGSAGPKRFQLMTSIGRLIMSDGKIKAEVLRLMV